MVMIRHVCDSIDSMPCYSACVVGNVMNVM